MQYTDTMSVDQMFVDARIAYLRKKINQMNAPSNLPPQNNQMPVGMGNEFNPIGNSMAKRLFNPKMPAMGNEYTTYNPYQYIQYEPFGNGPSMAYMMYRQTPPPPPSYTPPPPPPPSLPMAPTSISPFAPPSF